MWLKQGAISKNERSHVISNCFPFLWLSCCMMLRQNITELMVLFYFDFGCLQRLFCTHHQTALGAELISCDGQHVSLKRRTSVSSNYESPPSITHIWCVCTRSPDFWQLICSERNGSSGDITQPLCTAGWDTCTGGSQRVLGGEQDNEIIPTTTKTTTTKLQNYKVSQAVKSQDLLLFFLFCF